MIWGQIEHTAGKRAIQPWVESPFRLISWLEMNRFSAKTFYNIGRVLTGLLEGAQKDTEKNEDSTVPKMQAEEVAIGFDAIRQHCEAIGLRISAKSAQRVAKLLRSDEPWIKNMPLALEGLQDNIQWEMEDELFFHIPAARAEFYDQAYAFGMAVAQKFPDSEFDIREAGNCYATGRATASVFHLMRVTELGLRELAARLGITYQPSWNAYIQKINDEIAKKHTDKSPDWKRHEPFFKDVASDLVAVKNAWRNTTMHIETIYTLEDAEHIYRATKTLMQRIADNGTGGA